MKVIKQVGDYNLINNLGKGAFGQVYQAYHIRNKKIYAIKQIEKRSVFGTKKAEEFFKTEIEALKRINHPNVIFLKELIESSRNFYLVLQYCNGGDLENLLKKRGRLEENEATYFLMQIMNGFRALRERKIMHRDLKPANILLNNDLAIIADFGLSKVDTNMAETVVGTPIYMAPELHLNSLVNNRLKKVYTSSIDLWSIGVVFYEMLFGQIPWKGFKNIIELSSMMEVNSGEGLIFPPNIKISDSCQDLLKRLINPDPRERLSWEDFFNHEHFRIHKIEKYTKTRVLKELEDKNNIKAIEEEFYANKEKEKKNKKILKEKKNLKENKDCTNNKVKENNKCNYENGYEYFPYKSNFQKNNTKNYKQKNEKEEEKENFIKFEKRIEHEKEIFRFGKFTCVRIRKLVKKQNNDENDDDSIEKKIAPYLMSIALLILKKMEILNTNLLLCISDKVNPFITNYCSISNYVESERWPSIKYNLREEIKSYKEFLEHIIEKMEEEADSSHKFFQKCSNLAFNHVIDLKVIESTLTNALRAITNNEWIKNAEKIMKPSFKSRLKEIRALVFLILTSHENFAYKEKELIFDWNNFYEDFEKGKIRDYFGDLAEKKLNH